MDGARSYYAKQNKSVRERQIPYGFTHMWNLKNLTKQMNMGKGRKNKIRCKLRGRQTIRDAEL